MKRFATWMLLLALSVSVLLTGVSAADADDSNINENLVVHYDFEGTDEEYLTNKAPNNVAEQLLAAVGKEDLSDCLQVKSATGFVRDTVQGTLTSTEKTDSVYVEQALAEQVVRGEYTLFVRFKLEDRAEATEGKPVYYTVADMRTFGSASKRPLGLQYADTVNGNDGVFLAISSVANAGVAKAFTGAHPFDDVNNRFVNVAIVVSNANTDAGGTPQYEASMFLSNGLPDDFKGWSVKRTKWAIGEDISEVASHLYLFSKGNDLPGVTIDDFRLYNTDLTRDQIGSIIPNGNFAREVRFAGTQESGIANDRYSLRFIATLDHLNYTAAGFELGAVSESGSYDLSKSCTVVYNSILATDAGGKQQTVTADSLYGEYCMALSVTDIPVSEGVITWTVRAWVMRNGEKLYTDTYRLMVTPGTDGVSVASVPAE